MVCIVVNRKFPHRVLQILVLFSEILFFADLEILSALFSIDSFLSVIDYILHVFSAGK